jgi:hypothetical protein
MNWIRLPTPAKTIILCLFFLAVFFLFIHGQSDYSVEEALKVFSLIAKLEAGKTSDHQGRLRSIEVTESELNSYFAYRIEAEKEEVMKALHLKILKNNRIEGRVLLDLKGQKLPDLLRPEMNIYFAGRVEVKEDKVRIAIRKLFLEDQPVQPEIFDVIIFLISKIQNTETTSLYDWYDLPFGIKDIKSKVGKAIFFY